MRDALVTRWTAKVAARIVDRAVMSPLGHRVFSERTRSGIQRDLRRFVTRRARHGQRDMDPPYARLHLGSGTRRVPGWLNVDMIDSDLDVDLAAARLPWRSGVFQAVVSQHVIEHLDLRHEGLPLLKEVCRVLRPRGELWISCPDIAKVCRSYVEHGMQDLLSDRLARWPSFSLHGLPPVHLANHLFHQDGEHVNLFDRVLMVWALERSGFSEITQVAEADLLARFPGFPERKDDAQSLYVRAIAGADPAGGIV